MVLNVPIHEKKAQHKKKQKVNPLGGVKEYDQSMGTISHKKKQHRTVGIMHIFCTHILDLHLKKKK